MSRWQKLTSKQDIASIEIHPESESESESESLLQRASSRLWGVISLDLAFKATLERAIGDTGSPEAKDVVETILKEWRRDEGSHSRKEYNGRHFLASGGGRQIPIFM